MPCVVCATTRMRNTDRPAIIQFCIYEFVDILSNSFDTQIYILFPINTFIFVHVDHFVFYDLYTLRNSRDVNHFYEFWVNHPRVNLIFMNFSLHIPVIQSQEKRK